MPANDTNFDISELTLPIKPVQQDPQVAELYRIQETLEKKVDVVDDEEELTPELEAAIAEYTDGIEEAQKNLAKSALESFDEIAKHLSESIDSVHLEVINTYGSLIDKYQVETKLNDRDELKDPIEFYLEVNDLIKAKLDTLEEDESVKEDITKLKNSTNLLKQVYEVRNQTGLIEFVKTQPVYDFQAYNLNKLSSEVKDIKHFTRRFRIKGMDAETVIKVIRKYIKRYPDHIKHYQAATYCVMAYANHLRKNKKLADNIYYVSMTLMIINICVIAGKRTALFNEVVSNITKFESRK